MTTRLDERLTLSGSRLADLIRRRELSSIEVVDAHIRKIEEVNPTLNAVVATRFDEARAEAKEADERAGVTRDLPVFHGVPCTIKEAFALRGMPSTSGLVARKGLVSDRDAPAVSMLRRAGAIPLGVTNVSELCMWMESNNRVYGLTNNPYDPRRTAGGSSGGEGAIVGAGGSPFGLGSDVGGSIRMPAFFGGVFGHKCTGGLVDSSGQYPAPTNDTLLRYVSTGPICRRAEDLAPLMNVLTEGRFGDPGAVDPKAIEVVSIEDNGRTSVSASLRRAQEEACRALAAMGAKVRYERLPELERSLEIWSAMLHTAGGPSFAELLGDGAPVSALPEFLRWIAGRSPHTLPAIGLAAFEKLPYLMPDRTRRFVALGEELYQRLSAMLGPNGVLLYPPYARPAPLHHRPLLRLFDWVYTAIFNVLEMPSTAVPLGLCSPEGGGNAPLGVQVVALRGGDVRTVAVATWLERFFGGWVPPLG